MGASVRRCPMLAGVSTAGQKSFNHVRVDRMWFLTLLASNRTRLHSTFNSSWLVVGVVTKLCARFMKVTVRAAP